MLLAAFTLAQVLNYPFPEALVRDNRGTAIAYTLVQQGVRTLWFARAPQWTPVQLFSSGGDDGQEISNLVIAKDGAHVVYVRGGDHDANWPLPLQPGPASMPQQPDMQVWSVATSGGSPKLLGDGDAPAVSPDGTRVVFTADGAVMTAPTDGSVSAKRLFFDRGQDSDLQWSPDGTALAFVSTRSDHSFIGLYRNDAAPIQFLAPTTSQDFMPRWSPDNSRIAFVRLHGDGGAPQNPLDWIPTPWEIWVADASSGSAHRAWASGDTPRASLPQSAGGPFLAYAAGDLIVFKSEQNNWLHLYAVSANGGPARLLTPGNFIVEDVDMSPDSQSVVYSANTGSAGGDGDRRHVFRVSLAEGAPVQIAGGGSSETNPVALAGGDVAFDRATAQQPLLVTLDSGGAQRALDASLLPADFPSSQLVTPHDVTFRAADGMLVHGQLFLPSGGGKHPGVVFVHGGPPRQMLLTWHYMDYYSNAYAMNQYLASRGFVVLAVNYRLGIGYGHDFNFPPRWGPTGASEYQDVVAGARFLQSRPNVDPKRIGIWGGSYGGYLTALALARNSEIFKTGVDFHGVHDWSLDIENPVWAGTQLKRYQQYDTRAIMKLAWESSPDSAIATWKSPVLLIQGDDDRNVEFHQMVDLVERLRVAHVNYEQIVIPNEIHGFLRYASWLQADTATAAYFERELGR
ncbi:MAG TPA: prolyl oligopeptidase family serine peptidase [Candidatus Cybelea sp.]|jgi:dipeptidyl aminopeptidase/acylaminoacyl peptidase|nr:prolyl oligopeptidase family serine peptidase [Candidatus Cybelea sp.]